MIGLLGKSPGLLLQRPPGTPRRDVEVNVMYDVGALIACRELWRSQEGMESLAHWVAQFNHRRCENPEDYVYGYIALDKDGFVQPDHTLSWQDLYRTTTKHFIMQNGALDFICLGQGPDRDASLPSWVPDLQMPMKRSQPIFPQMNIMKPVYDASLSRRPDVTFNNGTHLACPTPNCPLAKIHKPPNPHPRQAEAPERRWENRKNRRSKAVRLDQFLVFKSCLHTILFANSSILRQPSQAEKDAKARQALERVGEASDPHRSQPGTRRVANRSSRLRQGSTLRP